MALKGWKVELLDEQDQPVSFRVPFLVHPIFYDIVFFDSDMTRDEVKRSLVDHDGYPSNITVTRDW